LIKKIFIHNTPGDKLYYSDISIWILILISMKTLKLNYKNPPYLTRMNIRSII